MAFQFQNLFFDVALYSAVLAELASRLFVIGWPFWRAVQSQTTIFIMTHIAILAV